jgi:hypothetical protein
LQSLTLDPGSAFLPLTMAASSSNIVFDDIFTINGIDKEGKKFDRGLIPAIFNTTLSL